MSPSSLAKKLAIAQREASGRRPSILKFNIGIDPELIELMTAYQAATKDLQELSMVTPSNSRSVRPPYIAAKKAGEHPPAPVFEQNAKDIANVIGLEPTIHEFYDKLDRLVPQDFLLSTDIIRRDFKAKLRKDLTKVALAKSVRGGKDSQSKELVEQLYGSLELVLRRRANKRFGQLLQYHARKTSPTHAVLSMDQISTLMRTKTDVEEFAKMFDCVCRKHEFPGGVKLLTVDTLSRLNIEMRPRTRDSFAKIPSSRHASWAKNLQTAVHETTHARCAFNLHALTNGCGVGEYNEALSTAKEYEFTDRYLGSPRIDEERCYYVFAVDMALMGHGFNEIYDEILARMLAAGEAGAYEQAWVTTERVLRGAADYANNHACYAHTKALSYFSGQVLYEEFKAAGVTYFLEAGLSDPDVMLQLANLCDWHGGKDILPYEDTGISESYMLHTLLPSLGKA